MACFRSKAATALLTVTVLAACSGKNPYSPGTPVGTFHVTAKLAQSTCGAAPDPWVFDVRLSYDGSTLYWVQGGAPISGAVDATHRVAMHAQNEQTLRPADARGRTPACTVVRDDRLDVALAADGDAAPDELDDTTRFTGKLSYGFTPTSDSDCADQTSASGGDFAALPCQVDYDVTATRATTTPTTK